MKVLVTGVKGQLGYDVVKQLESIQVECKGVDIDDFSLLDEKATFAAIKSYKPDVIVHCAAYTAVDNAEDEQELCYAVNVIGTAIIAKVSKEIGAKLVYISTDYVFEGTGEKYYEIDDAALPINYYGITKWQGEEEVRNCIEEHFIIRISWVFGKNGNNFVKTMLRLAETRDQLSVVNDQFGSPTYTYDVANLISEMIQTEKYGTYHATNEGVCSWYDFAKEIFKIAEVDIAVNPISSENYPVKAKRPYNSRMSKRQLTNAGFELLPTWESALDRYLKEI